MLAAWNEVDPAKVRGHLDLALAPEVRFVDPSVDINKKFQTNRFLLESGKIVSGVIVKETDTEFHVVSNLLAPNLIAKIKKSEIDERFPSTVSPMPQGMANVLTRPEIIDLLSFLETGYNLPPHLRHKHHGHGEAP